MKLLGSNSKAEVTGQYELPGKSNYFIGNDPKNWHTDVRQFSKVRYANVYPAVDLVYYGHQKELEYDFVLHPGASPQAIRLWIEGARRPRLEYGGIVLTSVSGNVHLRPPHVYQEADGVRHDVRGRYVLKSNGEVGFEVAGYDRRRELVIDPVLAFSTYLGGSGVDSGTSIAVGVAHNVYVTGYTSSTDFPLVNARQTVREGADDAFVTKLNADGTALVYSTYLGGIGDNVGTGIAVDTFGNAYVCGVTTSPDFPVANAFQPNLKGFDDGFVTKISAHGNELLYSTYLGGSIANWATGIAIDSTGAAYVVGWTGSDDFPTVNAIQSTLGGVLRSSDAFITKFKPDGSALVYSTYLGGTEQDIGESIAVDSVGNAYVTGGTGSIDFPTKNALQPTNAGNGDVFVTKINAAGSALVYSTYLGGNASESGFGIAVDSMGNAYVTGQTSSTDFPTLNAIQPSCGGCQDAYVTKINATGSALVYSTYLGGSGSEEGRGIAVDASGNAYVAGNTDSTNFPVANAFQPTNQGGSDMFVTEINALGNAFIYSTYLGGKKSDVDKSIALDSRGSVYITGDNTGGTTGGPFPTTSVAFQQVARGGNATKGPSDAVVAKIAGHTSISISAAKLTFALVVIGTTSMTKTLTVTNHGSGTVTINKIYVGGFDPGDFGETNSCGSTLAANASCTISATFTPTAKGLRKAGLAISSSDPASPDAVPLTGTGTVVSLSTKKLLFGDQHVGTTSVPQKVTLTNVGGTQLNFTGISITGVNAGDFSQANTCGTSIAAKASCMISVTFKPTATGTREAYVSIGDDGGGSPQHVHLTGKGT